MTFGHKFPTKTQEWKELNLKTEYDVYTYSKIVFDSCIWHLKN